MVTFVGSGPGDPGLITVKGLRRLNEADVVLYDRLVGDEILSLMPAFADKIDVGKIDRYHPVPQYEINSLLLTKAKQGLNVVRLKGGDPFLFGRGGEEAEILAENNIEFEIVPGVSSAISGGSYAGIPVTHRDYASSLHIFTGHAKKDGRLDINFDVIAKLEGTLVFMMGVSKLREICEELIYAGMETDIPAAIIENATCCAQRKFIGTLATLPSLADENNIVSPAVIIVGKVCSLSSKLDWFSHKPLPGLRVLVTRSANDGNKLAEKLRDMGCQVIELPCMRTVPIIEDNFQLNNAVNNIMDYSWLIFTSSVGVKLFFEYLSAISFDIRNLRHLKIAAVGSGTKKEIQKFGIMTDFIPEICNGAGLAKELLPHIQKGERLLLPRSKIGSKEIIDIFSENHINCESIAIYDTIIESRNKNSQNSRIMEMLLNRTLDCVTFTSPSAVEGFAGMFPDIDFTQITALAIGEKTAEAARKYCIPVIVSEKTTFDSMAETIKARYSP